MNIKEKIRNFIQQNLVVFEDEAHFEDNDNIFEMGFVNSLFAMKMVSYIEQEFQISIEDDDLEVTNFSSVDRIVEFVENKSQG